MKHLFGSAGDDRPEYGNMNRIGHVRRRRARLIFLTALLGVSGWIKAFENPFVGNWALSLPNGEPGWLGIVETNGVLRGQLLWGTGSIEPIARFTLNEGHLERIMEMPFKAIGSLPGQSNILEFTRQQEDTVLRGGVEVPVVEIETVRAMREGSRLRLVTERMREGAVVVRRELVGEWIPPAPAAPDLARVKFAKPIQLFNGRDLAGWRLVNPNQADGASRTASSPTALSKYWATRRSVAATCARSRNSRISG